MKFDLLMYVSFVIFQAILSSHWIDMLLLYWEQKINTRLLCNSVSGSVTNYGTKIETFQCSPKQRIDIKRAVYGDFYKNGKFDGSARIDTKCSALTNCQVKSRCGGMKSCEFTVNGNLLTSQYCPDTGKEIYTEHECVDTYSSTTITGKVDHDFFCVGVLYSGEYETSGVTLSVYPHRASLKNMPGHGPTVGSNLRPLEY